MTEPDTTKGVTMDARTPKTDAEATFQTVLDQIDVVLDLNPRKRREMSSAIHSFAAKLHRQPCDIPARLDVLEPLGRELNAVRLGISGGRLRNLKSLVRQALIATGHSAAMARLDIPLQRPWATLVDLLPDRRSRIALARLFRIFRSLGNCAGGGFASGVCQSIGIPTRARCFSARCQLPELRAGLEPFDGLAFAIGANLVVEVPNRRNWFSLRLKSRSRKLLNWKN